MTFSTILLILLGLQTPSTTPLNPIQLGMVRSNAAAANTVTAG
jgi:hypothetical protein